MNKNRRQVDKGFALLLVMIMVAVAVVLGVSYLSIASARCKARATLSSCSIARSLAESGLEHAMYILQTAPDSITSQQPKAIRLVRITSMAAAITT